MPIADLTPVPNTKPTINRDKVVAALSRCVGLHTSTTCLDCPYRADLNKPVHYGDVSCKDALLRDCHIALTEYTSEMIINDFAEELKKKYEEEFGCDWHSVYDPIDDLVKEMVGEEK